VQDAWPVVTESYTQWVIEDDFPHGRPDWRATFVKESAPFELMKLRLLNGAHSCIAYLGYLAGYETVAEAMADPAMQDFILRLMTDEVSPMLKVPPGADIPSYRAALIERFGNPALRHRTWQIAMDGSQKLPQRLLGTIRERLQRNLSIDCLVLGVAAWMRYVTGKDEHDGDIDVRDPLRDELRKRTDAAGLDARKLVANLLDIETIFGSDLKQQTAFVEAVTRALDSLIVRGARQALRDMLRKSS
jgi:fructuronate reductase